MLVFMYMKKIIFVMIMLSTAFSGAKAQKVGVALSGGAALGYAHLGVLQAMEEAGIRPECVSGTSMGAVMGMMYAAGYKPQEIKEIIKKEHFDHLWGLFGPSLPRRGGVIPMERIRKVLLKYVPHDCFDSLPIRFYTCSYDITNLRPLYCGNGNSLVAHVLASAAIPGVFVPQRIDSSWHVDGGVDGHDVFAAKATDALDTKNELRTFYENGGALFLTRYATNLPSFIGVTGDDEWTTPNNCWGQNEDAAELCGGPWSFRIFDGQNDHPMWQ
ncbi:MAG: patatin-like phospholipase family protein, partial [Bacteroidales bacterium]|nr:patatin-like phospholipase family protein [Bacteroidales bacterium]